MKEWFMVNWLTVVVVVILIIVWAAFMSHNSESIRSSDWWKMPARDLTEDDIVLLLVLYGILFGK